MTKHLALIFAWKKKKKRNNNGADKFRTFIFENYMPTDVAAPHPALYWSSDSPYLAVAVAHTAQSYICTNAWNVPRVYNNTHWKIGTKFCFFWWFKKNKFETVVDSVHKLLEFVQTGGSGISFSTADLISIRFSIFHRTIVKLIISSLLLSLCNFVTH